LIGLATKQDLLNNQISEVLNDKQMLDEANADLIKRQTERTVPEQNDFFTEQI